MADTTDSKSVAARRVGSSPTLGISSIQQKKPFKAFIVFEGFFWLSVTYFKCSINFYFINSPLKNPVTINYCSKLTEGNYSVNNKIVKGLFLLPKVK